MDLLSSSESSKGKKDCITREEGARMSHDFTTYLKNFEIQTHELRNLNKTLYEKFEREAYRNDNLRNSIVESKSTIERQDNELLDKIDRYNYLEAQIQKESSMPVIDAVFQELVISSSPDNISTAEIYKKCLTLIQYLSTLEKNIIRLNTKEELLTKKLYELNLKFVSEISCVRCREIYIPSQNHNEACKFHPGNVRYFSCRGCGADAYFECCNRCKNCLAGCKTSHHSS